jgi:hypothetical protein
VTQPLGRDGDGCRAQGEAEPAPEPPGRPPRQWARPEPAVVRRRGDGGEGIEGQRVRREEESPIVRIAIGLRDGAPAGPPPRGCGRSGGSQHRRADARFASRRTRRRVREIRAWDVGDVPRHRRSSRPARRRPGRPYYREVCPGARWAAASGASGAGCSRSSMPRGSYGSSGSIVTAPCSSRPRCAPATEAASVVLARSAPGARIARAIQ